MRIKYGDSDLYPGPRVYNLHRASQIITLPLATINVKDPLAITELRVLDYFIRMALNMISDLMLFGSPSNFTISIIPIYPNVLDPFK